MSIKINYSNKANSKPLANFVLFTDEKFNTNGLKKYLSSAKFSYIEDLLKNASSKLYFKQYEKTKNLKSDEKYLNDLILLIVKYKTTLEQEFLI